MDAKQDFIDDYVDAALESPHDSRDPDEVYHDAEVEWESTQIDAAYERARDEGTLPPEGKNQ